LQAGFEPMLRRVRDFVALLHSDDLVIRSPMCIGLCVLFVAAVAIWSLVR
jgi:hypothetical protein